jgi:hypothetical protein
MAPPAALGGFDIRPLSFNNGGPQFALAWYELNGKETLTRCR